MQMSYPKLDQEIQTPPFKYWTHHGRVNRISYLGLLTMGILLVGLASGCIAFILLALGISVKSGEDFSPAFLLVILALAVIYTIFSWLVTIRRLHDFNCSGWWSLLQLVPYVNTIFPVVLCCVAGNRENNDYGSPRPSTPVEKIMAGLLIVGTILLFAFLFTFATSYKIPM